MRRQRIALTALALAAVATGSLAYRSWVYLQRFGPLLAMADSFPRTYELGRGERLLYVSLGDSTAAGVGVSRVEDTLPFGIAQVIADQGHRVAVRNLARSSARLADVVQNQLPELPAERADLVTVSISANDATHGTELERLRSDLRKLLDVLQSRRAKVVLLTTTPSFRTTPAVPLPARWVLAARAQRQSRMIRDVAAAYPFVRIVDLFERGTIPADEYARDGFHPNAAGYRRWVTLFTHA